MLWAALKKLGVLNVLVDVLRSFCSHIKVRITVDFKLLEEIEVENGPRQECTMGPPLFNLYACVVAERWLERVCDVKDLGTQILFKSCQEVNGEWLQAVGHERRVCR